MTKRQGGQGEETAVHGASSRARSLQIPLMGKSRSAAERKAANAGLDDVAGVVPEGFHDEESVTPQQPVMSWKATLLWAGSVLLFYFIVQLRILPSTMHANPSARALMLSQVPIRIYQYSEAAFFTAAVLNVISFLFEETQEKRQLALLAALIKGLSWHCDYLIVTGQAVITFDAYGALLLPSRYVQWSCTTPTMLFSLSKISDFTVADTAMVMFSDWIMILTGYIAAVYPPGFVSYSALVASFATMFIVLHGLYRMIHSAATEASSYHEKRSLTFTLWSSIIIWNLFPVAWLLARMGPNLSAFGEPLLIFSNFSAKVVFSSCILYNNYVTLQQRRLKAQLEQEQRDRIRLVEELKTAVQSKDDFISVIGHELRTPLNAIIQLSSAMSVNIGAPDLIPSHRVWMETISRSAKHLLGIINDIITIKAARSGMHIKQNLVHMKGVVDHVMYTLNPMAKRGVALERFIADNLPPIVADERRIIQVLSNLLGNALKFTDKGKVSVSVRVDKGARNIIIKVQDTGCGIPKKELKKLLVPFKQVDMSTSRKYGGTGLGLSIAHQLVQAHSGTIELMSDEGTGTSVVVKLPVLQPETQGSLEIQFREAYTAAGYNFEELISPDVAKAEGRRSAVFCSTTTSPGKPPASDALQDHTGGEVERFYWDMHYPPVSAAGSSEAGPPPIAVALASSLYSSTAPPLPHDPTADVPLGIRVQGPPSGPSSTRSLALEPRSPTTHLAGLSHPHAHRLSLSLGSSSHHNADDQGLELQLQLAEQALALAIEAEQAMCRERQLAVAAASSAGAVSEDDVNALELQLAKAQEALNAAMAGMAGQASPEVRELCGGHSVGSLELQLVQAQKALGLALEAGRRVSCEHWLQPGVRNRRSSECLGNLELQLQHAETALAVAIGAAEAGAGGAAKALQHAAGQQQLHASWSAPGRAMEGCDDGDDDDDDDDDEVDAYAGSWHRAPQFGDHNDGNKEYYSYESRMSYDYRPSLDLAKPSRFFRDAQRSKSAWSAGAGLKSAIRHSIDTVRLRTTAAAGLKAGEAARGQQ